MKDRFQVLDSIRGLACLAVALFHFAPKAGENPWLSLFTSKGYLGVYGFFVVSGLVIPLSLHRSGYSWPQAGRFLWKRILRLHPPFLISVIVALGLGALANTLARESGPGWPPSVQTVLANLFYLPDILGLPKLLYSYWTLPLELQFYAFLALLFPAFVHPQSWVRFVSLTATMLSSAFTSGAWVFFYLPCFLFGLLLFMKLTEQLTRLAFASWTSVLTAWVAYWHGGWIAAACLLTVLTILYIRRGPPWLTALGTISYSLYLIHEPIGGFVTRVVTRLLPASPSTSVWAMMASLTASLLAAWIFWRWIESPSAQASSRVILTPKIAAA